MTRSASSSQLLFQLMGQPPSSQCEDVGLFRCWVCAGVSVRGARVDRWMGSNFVGQNRVRSPDSEYTCEACVVVMSGRPPNTMRMYTHLVDDRGWLKLNKGDKASMREWLRSPKRGRWFAAIADSGQKHVVPWAPINESAAGGRVLFEEMTVTLPHRPEGWRLLDDIASVLTAGATKEEIETADYCARAWSLCRSQLADFEKAHGAERHGSWFTLALWLAQRDEGVVQARLEREKEEKRAQRSRKGASKNAHGRGDSRGTKRLPANVGGERAQALGSDSRPGADGGTHEQQSGGVDHDALSIAQDRRPQLGLFSGDDGPHS